ncbi:unnamed protein product [Schistosoma turkestanicum]|nr:unnamed protein product [Schistosoma turkestanicum]
MPYCFLFLYCCCRCLFLEKVTTPIKLDELAMLVAKSSNHKSTDEEDDNTVNTKHESDANKVLPAMDDISIVDDSTTRLSTVVILVLVLLCCFLGLLAGVACFSVTWIHRKRHDLEREKHQIHKKTLLIRGEDALNVYTTTGLHGNSNAVNPIGSGGGYTTVRPNMYPFLLSSTVKPEIGVSTVLPNGGLQSYHQIVVSSNTSTESPNSILNDKNSSQQYLQSNIGRIIGQQQQQQLNTIVNCLSDGGDTIDPNDGVTSETEAFCDKMNKHDHVHDRDHNYQHHHYPIRKQQQSSSSSPSSVLSSLLCLSKIKKHRSRQSSIRINQNNRIISQLDHTPNNNIHGNVNSKETGHMIAATAAANTTTPPTTTTTNTNNNNNNHAEFLNPVNNFSGIAQLDKSQSGHNLGLRSTDLLNAHLRGQTSVQAANGLLQIDLSRGHPSMLINGRPLMRISASSNPSDVTDNSWLLQTGYRNNNAVCCASSIGMNLLNSEPGVYTTVGGAESDVDSNGASTMSPEYASTSMLHDYPMLAATLAQLNQQRLAAASLTQPSLYPCSNPLNNDGLSSNCSVNFNVLSNPPLNTPFDSSNNNINNHSSAYGNHHQNHFLTSANSIQQPLLFTNPHSMHDMMRMMMLTSATTTALTTTTSSVSKLSNGIPSSHNAPFTETNNNNNNHHQYYGGSESDILQNIFQQTTYQAHNPQIYDTYNLPTPSAPIYYSTTHQMIPSTMGQYFPCSSSSSITSTQSTTSSSSGIPSHSVLSSSSASSSSISCTKNSNNAANTNPTSTTTTVNGNATLLGRGAHMNNEYKGSKRHDIVDVKQSHKRSDVNKFDFNVKSTRTTNTGLSKSNYQVSNHNPWIKASNSQCYDELEEIQRGQRQQQHQQQPNPSLLLPPTPSSPPPILPQSSTKTPLKHH